MRRRLLAPFLTCALLALPGCGNVEGVAKRSLVRFLSGTLAAMIFGSDEAAADDEEYVEKGDTTVAEDEGGDGGFFGNGEDASDDAAGSGFYKVVEANGTVRFVSNLAEVPAAQRPKAE